MLDGNNTFDLPDAPEGDYTVTIQGFKGKKGTGSTILLLQEYADELSADVRCSFYDLAKQQEVDYAVIRTLNGELTIVNMNELDEKE